MASNSTDSAITSENDIADAVESLTLDTDKSVPIVDLNDGEDDESSPPMTEEEAAKQAALAAIARGEKTPNEDRILAELDAELAEFAKTYKPFAPLDPALIASVEEYIEEMKAEAAAKPPVKLGEDPRKYEKNAGNDPMFASIPVYDPNEPRNQEIAAKIKGHIEEQEKLKLVGKAGGRK